MDNSSGEPVKLARTANTGKPLSRGPLQARLSSSDQIDAESTEEDLANNEETRHRLASKITNPAPPPRGEETSDQASAADPAQSLAAIVPATGLVRDLRHLAESLLSVADTLEKLDGLFHFDHMKGLPSHEAPPAQVSQLIKGRPDLQQLLRDYLFR
ncbi:MAG: hypothetical protein C7B45_05285 [Sulfobacillus acidophilus]|uniref:Uncharacterized protein n=1 Tax=Sulfobacillus acidophilus TaxID=53633 RepID=A0A2T2WKY2_9FIRM|nr:MAG: hypothetical protein C7B45_05285 [Sulfobacillus acidophilus]